MNKVLLVVFLSLSSLALAQTQPVSPFIPTPSQPQPPATRSYIYTYPSQQVPLGGIYQPYNGTPINPYTGRLDLGAVLNESLAATRREQQIIRDYKTEQKLNVLK